MPPLTRRNSVVRRGVGGIDHSAAERGYSGKAHHVRGKSKAFKKFEKKVMEVLKEDTPTGKYTHTSTLFLPVTSTPYATVEDKDMGDIGSATTGTESYLEFFSPRMFKDAEGVLFNGKLPSYNSWTTTANAFPAVAGTNLVPSMVTKVNGSSAAFHFKNQSQRQLTLEMYICYGRGSAGTTPRQDLQDGFNAQGNILLYQASGSPSAEYFRNYGVSLANVPSFHQQWECKKVVWEFEPGEEAWHIMKGPYAYKMDGSRKNDSNSLTAPSWMMPNSSGCGCYVMFRLSSDVSLISSSTGTYATIPADLGSVRSRSNRIAVTRGADFYSVGADGTSGAGGLAVVIQRHYNIELPEGFVPSAPYPGIVVWNGYGIPSGSTFETNIDEDNPATLPTNPPK